MHLLSVSVSERETSPGIGPVLFTVILLYPQDLERYGALRSAHLVTELMCRGVQAHF